MTASGKLISSNTSLDTLTGTVPAVTSVAARIGAARAEAATIQARALLNLMCLPAAVMPSCQYLYVQGAAAEVQGGQSGRTL